ncbi:MAG: hypothetical protein WBZ11_19015 [Candidatus Sulfotelmatobacter sp.]|jgi:hypothetical protein
MTKLSTFALAIAVSLGTTAMLDNRPHTINPNAGAEAQLSADSAFRDGIYQGKLASERGQPLSPSVGRWSAAQDRAMFAAGYSRGYSEAHVQVRP